MTSRSYKNVGLTQFLLALGFVIWLVFLPGYASYFAWPIGNRLTAMFIGTAFALRALEGFYMWREPNWFRLRWMSWGTLAFLTIIFIATYWHVDLINWKPFNPMAIIWVIAYTAEPLVVPFVEPRGVEGNADISKGEERRAVSNGLQNALTIVMFVAAVLFGMFFINPAKFITNYWPWPVAPFDARVIAAFFAGIVLWGAKMKTLRDWAEIRMGMQGFILFFGGHFLVWIFNLVTGQFDPTRTLSAWAYGILMGLLAFVLILFYFQHTFDARPLTKERS